MLISFWYGNMDLIYFLYGMAFLVLGVVIVMELRATRQSSFNLRNILWLLAAFGFVHGLKGFVDMFSWDRSGYFYFRPVNSLILIFAFFLVFLFGYRLINISGRKLGRWFPGLVAVLFVAMSFSFGFDRFASWEISARYFLGFIGELLVAIGFFEYFRDNHNQLKKIEAARFFIPAGVFFFILAVTDGLIVPRAGFFPASIINTRSFIEFFGLPIQVPRAVCAAGIAWSVWGILDLFNLESAYHLMVQKRLLWESDTKARKLLDSIPIGVIMTDLEGKILEINPAMRAIFGFSQTEDVSGLLAPDFYAESADRPRLIELLKKNGVVKDFRARFRKKNGSTFEGRVNCAIEFTADNQPQIMTAFEELSKSGER